MGISDLLPTSGKKVFVVVGNECTYAIVDSVTLGDKSSILHLTDINDESHMCLEWNNQYVGYCHNTMLKCKSGDEVAYLLYCSGYSKERIWNLLHNYSVGLIGDTSKEGDFSFTTDNGIVLRNRWFAGLGKNLYLLFCENNEVDIMELEVSCISISDDSIAESVVHCSNGFNIDLAAIGHFVLPSRVLAENVKNVLMKILKYLGIKAKDIEVLSREYIMYYAEGQCMVDDDEYKADFYDLYDSDEVD